MKILEMVFFASGRISEDPYDFFTYTRNGDIIIRNNQY